MHSFGRSFGLRKSDEDLQSGAEGGFRVPLTGTFLQGDLVEIDAASPGYLKKSADGAPLVPGVRGLVLQYDQLFKTPGVTGPRVYTDRSLSQVINGELAVILTGAGIKAWVRNLAAVTASAGHLGWAAETRCTATGIALADMVKWDGDKYVKTSTAAEAIGQVTGEISATGFAFVLNA